MKAAPPKTQVTTSGGTRHQRIGQREDRIPIFKGTVWRNTFGKGVDVWTDTKGEVAEIST